MESEGEEWGEERQLLLIPQCRNGGWLLALSHLDCGSLENVLIPYPHQLTLLSVLLSVFFFF